jgi:ABC-type polysaccharide/polyol phosphate export permease
MELGNPEDTLSDIEFSEATRAGGLADQIDARRGIPRLQPRTPDELPGVPPPRARYPTSLGMALRELAAGREQLRTFVERDLRVRYRQAVLGAAWALLQPLFLMVVFSIAFGRVAHVGSEGAPYALFSYSGLVPWGFLIGSITYGISNILTNAPIVRRIYLPRDVIPLASVLSAAVDFAASGVILLGMLIAYGYGPRVTWLAYPILLFVIATFAVAGTLIASLITVYFRDTRYAIPTLLQAVLFVTPVAYPLSKVMSALPPGWRSAYLYLNPLAPLMDGFHRVLLHGQWPAWGPVGSAAIIGVVAMILSYRLYKGMDPRFADVI